jgi:hypothetical protein
MENQLARVYVVDHRKIRNTSEECIAKFIYPADFDTEVIKRVTSGKYGADFAELRALEKSLETESYSGIFHYRRVLVLDEDFLDVASLETTWEGHFISAWNWAETSQLGWSQLKLNELSKRKAIVLPTPVDVRIFGWENLHQQFISSHGTEIIDALEKKWVDSEKFIEYLKKEHFLVPYNIFLAPFSIRRELYDWLIPILESIEPMLINLSDDNYQKRWPGFISERLLSYYWTNLGTDMNIEYRAIARLDKAFELDFYLPKSSKPIWVAECSSNNLLASIISIESLAINLQSNDTILILTTINRDLFAMFQSTFKCEYPDLSFDFVFIEQKSQNLNSNQNLFPFLSFITDTNVLLCFTPRVFFLPSVKDFNNLEFNSINPTTDSFEELFKSLVLNFPHGAEVFSNLSQNGHAILELHSLNPTKFPVGFFLLMFKNWRFTGDYWEHLQNYLEQESHSSREELEVESDFLGLTGLLKKKTGSETQKRRSYGRKSAKNPQEDGDFARSIPSSGDPIAVDFSGLDLLNHTELAQRSPWGSVLVSHMKNSKFTAIWNLQIELALSRSRIHLLKERIIAHKMSIIKLIFSLVLPVYRRFPVKVRDFKFLKSTLRALRKHRL